MATIKYEPHQTGVPFLRQLDTWVRLHPLECWRAQALCEVLHTVVANERHMRDFFMLNQDAMMEVMISAVSWGVTSVAEFTAWLRVQANQEIGTT